MPMDTSATTRLPRLLYKRLAHFSRLIGVGSAALGLFILILKDVIAFRPEAWTFVCAIALAWGFEAYLEFAPYLQNWRSTSNNPVESKDVFLYTPTNFLYRYRSGIRIFLFTLVAFVSGFQAVRLLQNQSADADQALTGGIAAILFYFFGITYIAWMQYVAIRSFPLGQRWSLWLLVSLAIGFVPGLALLNDRNPSEPVYIFAVAIWGFGISWIAYVERRLGISDQVWSEVIQDLSMKLMDVGALRENRSYIIELIGKRLRYERVFLLEPINSRLKLQVMAEYGDYPLVAGKAFPADRGITGRAFTTGGISAWNDVGKCPYYYQLISKDLDTTRSEIAVPIQYRGETYGVLDIQSRHSMVYGYADINSLETIANILGMAMATEKADLLLVEANDLWNQLSKDTSVETEAFTLIADFGCNKLGADLVVYYPMSPSGYPFKAPYVVGKLLDPDRLLSSGLSVSSPLVKLIDAWTPRFESDIGLDSIFYRNPDLSSSSFAVREKIQSVSFIPIGTKDERLGIVFLNYRRHYDFDSLYRLTVMAFAQAFATMASRERYRQIVFEGFGRPELGLHNIQARYGLKDGVLQEGRRVFTASCRTAFQTTIEVRECGMFDILRNVDHFLAEIRAQTSVEYDIWKRTLREAILDFTRRMKEQATNKHLWFITELDPQIERESRWTRLALYRVLTEAVNNGIFHGRASELDIVVQRRERSIYLRVANDGNPLPMEARRNRSRGGIFTLLDELEAQFGARVSIRSRDNGDGTIVEAEFPAVPMYAEVTHV